MKRIAIVGLLVLSIALLVRASQPATREQSDAPTPLENLMAIAIMNERSGDLAGAVVLYRSVLDSPELDPRLTVEATFRMNRCQVRLLIDHFSRPGVPPPWSLE